VLDAHLERYEAQHQVVQKCEGARFVRLCKRFIIGIVINSCIRTKESKWESSDTSIPIMASRNGHISNAIEQLLLLRCSF
jgi:hypothetical protein